MSGAGDDDPRRNLPSVDSLLARPDVAVLSESFGRVLVAGALRDALSEARSRVDPADSGALVAQAAESLRRASRPGLVRLINGTGVVLHTNLGRAPLSREATEALGHVASGYSNLEYDLVAGGRGDRYEHCRDLLKRLLAVPDALLVNNNAAAVVLTVNEFAANRDVLVSRGELVEIGGSFRIPEMIRRAGGRLVEVGTTNRTRVEDYRDALGDSTGLILKVHPGNYRIEGFAESAGLAELTELGRRAGIPVAWDLGSAAPTPALPADIGGPAPVRGQGDAATVVMWSGDKLLGGPQAGVLHGEVEAIERLRKNPLLRAFRVDKLTIAAMEATLRAWTDPELARRRVPVVRMLTESAADVEKRASAALESLPADLRDRVTVEAMESLVGAGSAPGATLASAGWALEGRADSLDAACRQSAPPLIGRVTEGRFLVDFRCIDEPDAAHVTRIVAEALRRA